MPEHKHGLASMAGCNFTMGGFARSSDLRLARRLGLKVIAMPDEQDMRTWSKAWKQLSDPEIDARIRRVVQQCGRSETVLGYFIMDEPGASYFPALAKAVAAVKKYAPGKLAYINLYPGYATLGATNGSQLETATFSEYLERFVQEAKPQVLSYDNYKVQDSLDLTQPDRAARYFYDLLEVRRVAQKFGLPFWNIVSANQIRPHTTIPSPANLALQAYTTLAAGGRGVSWYTYYARGYGYAAIDEAENKTVTWRHLQGVNHQIKVLGPIMNRLRSTGVFFTSPSPYPGLPALPGRVVEQIETSVPMLVGEFRSSDGADYCLVVNLSLERSAKFEFKAAGRVLDGEARSAEDGSPTPMNSKFGNWLTAGQGVLIRLVPARKVGATR